MKKINYYKNGNVIKYYSGGQFADDFLGWSLSPWAIATSLSAPYAGAGIGGAIGAPAGGIGAVPGGALGYLGGSLLSAALDGSSALYNLLKGNYVSSAFDGIAAGSNFIPGGGLYTKGTKLLGKVGKIYKEGRQGEKIIANLTRESAEDILKKRAASVAADKAVNEATRNGAKNVKQLKTEAEAAKNAIKTAEDEGSVLLDAAKYQYGPKITTMNNAKNTLSNVWKQGMSIKNLWRRAGIHSVSGGSNLMNNSNSSAPPVQRGDGSMLKVDTVTKKPIAAKDSLNAGKYKFVYSD